MSLRIGRTLPPAAAPLRLGELIAGVAGIFEGEAVLKRFQDELKTFFRSAHCYTVSSGKAGLVLILQAMHELSPGRDQVLIPAYTCYSVPSAIARAGLKVRLLDLAAGTLDFDFELLQGELDNPRLLCVVPTHLFGLPADVARVKHLVQGRGIFVLEDAAQAMGGEAGGRKLGTQGDAGVFSMGRGKALSTVAGGVILTDNDLIAGALAKRVGALAGYRLRDYLGLVVNAIALWLLISPWIYWLPKSLPFLQLGQTHFDTSFPVQRLSLFQAGIALGWKDKIEHFRKIRSENVKRIMEKGIRPPVALGAVIPDLIRFPVLIADADAKREILRKSDRAGLGIAEGYPDSIDGIEGLEHLSGSNSFPQAKKIAELIVSLPVHPFVKGSDILNMVLALDPESG